MNDIKRLTPSYNNIMCEDLNGDYCLYSDYELLLVELAYAMNEAIKGNRVLFNQECHDYLFGVKV